MLLSILITVSTNTLHEHNKASLLTSVHSPKLPHVEVSSQTPLPLHHHCLPLSWLGQTDRHLCLFHFWLQLSYRAETHELLANMHDSPMKGTQTLSYKLVFKRNGLRVIYAIILLTLSPISLFLSGVSLTNQWLLLWLARAPMALPSSRRKKLSKTNTKFFSRKYIFTPVLPPHSTVLFYLWYFVVHRQTRWTNRLQRCQPCLLGAHFPQYSTRLFSGNTSATATVRGKRGENVFSGSLLIWYLYICPAIRRCLPITQAHKGLKSGQRLDDLMGGKKKKSPPQASAPAAPGNGVVEEPRKQAATSKPAKDSKSKGENHSQREHFTPRLRRLHCIFTPINKILVWI